MEEKIKNIGEKYWDRVNLIIAILLVIYSAAVLIFVITLKNAGGKIGNSGAAIPLVALIPILIATPRKKIESPTAKQRKILSGLLIAMIFWVFVTTVLILQLR